MQEYETSLRENIGKLFILYAVRGALIHVGVLVLFLQSQGLSLQQILMLQATWSVIQVTLEIPSGYLSDAWGRKNTALTGAICKFLGALTYCLSTTFPGFLLAICFLALGSTLYSGTMEALTYDTLLELGEEKRYRYIAGRQGVFQFGTEAIGSIIGGLLALISLRAPLFGTLAFFSIAPITAATLTEPKRHKSEEKAHMKAMWKIFQSTMQQRALRTILLLNSILITMAFTLYWFTQPYQHLVGLPIVLFGVTHALIVACHAVASSYAHRMEQLIDNRIFLILIAVTIIVSFFILGTVSSLFAIVCFFLVRFAWGCTFPLISDLINRMTRSDVRATVLSLRAFGFRFLFAITSPFLGSIADLYSLHHAILIAGIVGSIAILIALLSMRAIWHEIPA